MRTLFNILGPLTNPAGATQHPDGRVPCRSGRHPGARAAAPGCRTRAGGLGARRHGRDIARRPDAGRRTARRRACANTKSSRSSSASPAPTARCCASRARRSRRRWCSRRSANTAGPARDIVMLNAGAALYAADVADSIVAGVARAKAVLESGAARAKLDQFIAATQRLKSGRSVNGVRPGCGRAHERSEYTRDGMREFNSRR